MKKIKKISGLLSPLAKVLNLKSNSQKDTYSCNYINNATKEIYDEEERVIGTWFGKPLYRNVLVKVVPTFTAKTSFNLINLPSNVEEVVSISGCFIGANDSINLNYYFNANDYSRVWTSKEFKTVRMNSGATGLINAFTAKVILEYTKITD